MKTSSATDASRARSDVLTPEQRSRCMSRIRGKDTSPELIVRSLVSSMGYRYRLHDKRLPGSPDLVFKGRRKIIFVHGCFWHMHDCRYGQVKPKANAAFWEDKRIRNTLRDQRNIASLKSDGWAVLVIWECETKNTATLTKKIIEFLH
ncbi:very short patch repair endonuclease [Tepidimonas taiwanensis]|uniref:very short patch repair endonuclease n=1 Tax=Tepidimonas taiwanensis TaxID=307486 RepID=UPI0009DDB611|nr:very short patch repair endonuclease [Tepidimonas taiwanensis]